MKRIFIFMLILPLLPLTAQEVGGGIYAGKVVDNFLPQWNNNILGMEYTGLTGFQLTPIRSRMGWYARLGISTAPTTTNVLGTLSGGLLIGQELKFWLLSLSANFLVGAGVNASDMTDKAAHIFLEGEFQLEGGIYIAQWLELIYYGGFHFSGNILPFPSEQDRFLHHPLMGLKLIWYDL